MTTPIEYAASILEQAFELTKQNLTGREDDLEEIDSLLSALLDRISVTALLDPMPWLPEPTEPSF